MTDTFQQILADKSSLQDAAKEIAKWCRATIAAERCSLFLYEKKTKRLHTIWADGPVEIELPFDQGIVGETLRRKKILIENEPYGDEDFFADIDMQTGYYTKNILSAPLIAQNEDVYGVLQLINKKDGFDRQDLEAIQTIVNTINLHFSPSKL